MKCIGKLPLVLVVGIALSTAAPLRADTVLPVPMGSGPSGLTTDQSVLYLNSAAGGRDIYTLDPGTGAVLSSFPGYFETADLEFDGVNRIFLSNFNYSLVEEITLSGTLVNSFSVPFRPGAIAFDGTDLYIFDIDSSQVRVTDRSGAFVRSFSVSDRPISAVWDASTGHIITVDELDRNIRVIATDGTLLDSYQGPQFNTGTGQGGVTIVGTALYIVGTDAPGDNPDRIHVLDTVCGDGHLGPGEQCDDGNTVDGDCCSSTCQYEAIGSACSDGNPCTADACDGAGACVGQMPTGCKGLAKSALLLKNNADDSKDKLVWKWSKGSATLPTELGDPTAATDYTLCLYAGSASAALALPAGSSWRRAGATGYAFSDRTGTPNGVQKALLKSGAAGKAKVLVKAKGTNLPDSFAPALSLPVTAQLVNDTNGTCFEAVYFGAAKNTVQEFKAMQP